MSYSVKICSPIKVQPKSLFESLAAMGERIVVVSDTFPTIRFGSEKYALRGVDVNQIDDGYQVRICAMASMADYQLFPKVVSAMQQLTNGDVFAEDDDEPNLVKDPKKRFGLKWRRQQNDSSWHVTCMLLQEYQQEIIFQGLFAPFVIGLKMLAAYDIDLSAPTSGESYKHVEYQLFSAQWNICRGVSTKTNMILPNPKDAEQNLSISMIAKSNGEVQNFDYISYANLICFFDRDADKVVLIRYQHLADILPPNKFTLFDEAQYVKTDDITVDDFYAMMQSAEPFINEDLFEEGE